MHSRKIWKLFNFPLAGYASPGFHTWPPSHILQDNGSETASPHPAPCQKAFGAATGVSDPRLQKIRIRKNGAGGDAATVAGYAGPGFHNWPSGHIPQDNGSESASPHPAPCQKAFGAATGVSDPSYRRTGAHAPLPIQPTARDIISNSRIDPPIQRTARTNDRPHRRGRGRVRRTKINQFVAQARLRTNLNTIPREN